MQIDITINKGRGYVPADEKNREYCTDVNVIPIDSIYILRYVMSKYQTRELPCRTED